MHKSRLGTLIIDCRTDNLEREAVFWSAALGCTMHRYDEPENQDYIKLETDSTQPTIELQKVDHPSRVHLDIETDDIQAEVERLERLGAKKVAKVRDWWVMEAPSGHRFCVVRPQRADFEEGANVWSGPAK